MTQINDKVKKNFWENKRVFLTGHTGFKGSWLSLWLHHLGAKIKGYALEPDTNPSMFEEVQLESLIESEIGDIRDLDALMKSMVLFDPEIIIHLAAQPLVRRSYDDPITTYGTNVMGTVHVFEAARKCKHVKSIVNVTTDKCYENKEWDWGYRENESMGGHDPYSNSKGCAELVTSAYQRSYFDLGQSIALASARAGNVIGGGDWAEDRLIPDILRAFGESKSVIIRQPSSIRPWQHVLEPLGGYLLLAERLYTQGHIFAEGWNFGPNDSDVQSVEWIASYMKKHWGERAEWQLDPGRHPYEAKRLKLDISKAKNRLGWRPRWNIQQSIDAVIDWHKAWRNGENMQKFSLAQIYEFRVKNEEAKIKDLI